MTEVLVIVDMQVSFTAAQDAGLIAAIEKEAAAVSERGGHVVAISYDQSGMSTVSVPGAKMLWKNQDDGGTIVYAYLLGAGLICSDLAVRIAGCNLAACVFATACGLGQRLYEEHALCDHVTVATSLCGDGSRYRVRVAI